VKEATKLVFSSWREKQCNAQRIRNREKCNWEHYAIEWSKAVENSSTTHCPPSTEFQFLE
jgi:hypothetical protein